MLSIEPKSEIFAPFSPFHSNKDKKREKEKQKFKVWFWVFKCPN